jgi:putative DNA primase/helicase
MSQDHDHRKKLTNLIIEKLENGTAPWIKPWNPRIDSGPYQKPFNPITGQYYRGANALFLGSERFNDPRWCTYNQAKDQGWSIRAGEKGFRLEYYVYEGAIEKKDRYGNNILDQNGEVIKEKVEFDRPRVVYFVVFNGEQIEGIPNFTKKEYPKSHELSEKIERILESSQAKVFYDQEDRAFYNSKSDSIHLPSKEQFHSQESLQSTLLHELGHWTSHPSRLYRNPGNIFGSEQYAKEELRAELSSLFLAEHLGIEHNPGNHASYIQSWIKILKNDPHEIFRASRDAEKITEYVLYLDPERIVEKPIPLAPKEKIFLNVPFEDKNAAKNLGAQWDKKEKSWFITTDKDAQTFAKWLEPRAQKQTDVPQDPRGEFAEFLRSHGVDLKDLPVMDGRGHRVSILDDSGKEKSGSYRGFMDGCPNGTFHNFRTGETTKWVGKSHNTSLDYVQRNAETIQAKSEQSLNDYNYIAQKVQNVWDNLPEAPQDHPYLSKKQVPSIGLKIEKDRLVIPIQDVHGKIWTLQKINGDGEKIFEKGGKMAGNMYQIGGPIEPRQPIYIAEGYATAASVHLATEKPCMVSFSAHNLKSVVGELRGKYPENPIYIMADHDRSKSQNVGFEKAKEAANEYNARVILPKFHPDDKHSTDFNDIHTRDGLNTVTKQIQDRLDQDSQFDSVRALVVENIKSQPEEIQNKILASFDEKIRTEGWPVNFPQVVLQKKEVEVEMECER